MCVWYRIMFYFIFYIIFLLLCRSALLFVIRFGLSTIFLSNYNASVYILSYINLCIFITPSQAYYIVMNCYSQCQPSFHTVHHLQSTSSPSTLNNTSIQPISLLTLFVGSFSSSIHCILITF